MLSISQDRWLYCFDSLSTPHGYRIMTWLIIAAPNHYLQEPDKIDALISISAWDTPFVSPGHQTPGGESCED